MGRRMSLNLMAGSGRVCRKWVIARKIGSITNSSVKGLRCAGAIVVGWSGGEASAGKRIGGWQRKAWNPIKSRWLNKCFRFSK